MSDGRREEDDGAVVAQMGDRALGHQIRRAHVDLPLALEALERLVRDRGRLVDPRGEDQGVEHAQTLDGRVDDPARRLDLPQVGHDGRRRAGASGVRRVPDGVEPTGVATDERDAGAGGGEQPSRGRAHAGARARDDHVLAGEVELHGLLRSLRPRQM
jgi:hypothetical protein